MCAFIFCHRHEIQNMSLDNLLIKVKEFLSETVNYDLYKTPGGNDNSYHVAGYFEIKISNNPAKDTRDFSYEIRSFEEVEYLLQKINAEFDYEAEYQKLRKQYQQASLNQQSLYLLVLLRRNK